MLGTETVGLPWIVLLAFLSLTTRAGLFQKLLTVDAAFDLVDAWLQQPSITVPNLPRATCKRCAIWFRRWDGSPAKMGCPGNAIGSEVFQD
jgi:hypothetical protein